MSNKLFFFFKTTSDYLKYENKYFSQNFTFSCTKIFVKIKNIKKNINLFYQVRIERLFQVTFMLSQTIQLMTGSPQCRLFTGICLLMVSRFLLLLSEPSYPLIISTPLHPFYTRGQNCNKLSGFQSQELPTTSSLSFYNP